LVFGCQLIYIYVSKQIECESANTGHMHTPIYIHTHVLRITHLYILY